MGVIKAIHAGQVTELYSTAVEKLGTPRLDPSNGKKYVYVKNVDATALVLGSMVFQDTRTADANAMFEVTIVPGDADIKLVAGVAISLIAAGGYGWLQVAGEVDTALTSGAITTGGALTADLATGAGHDGYALAFVNINIYIQDRR